MTKTENRAAARAYHREKMQRYREEAHAMDVAVDPEQLRILRDYLIFKRKVLLPYDALAHAIDDYVERLTGDRTSLHGHNHSIG
jgi:hypothetical protein